LRLANHSLKPTPPSAARLSSVPLIVMSEFANSFLALTHQLLAERQEECLRNHSDLIVGIGGDLNLCLSLPAISRGVHGEDRLGVACVMHHWTIRSRSNPGRGTLGSRGDDPNYQRQTRKPT
jgi:hypothetical protein